jgi:hypothetical protein
MRQIPLQAIPNQNFSVSLDMNFYNITLNQTLGIVAATVYINDALIISGVRLVAGQPIIPYAYLSAANFYLLTSNNDLPNYTQFGVNQSLVFATASEIAAIVAES